MQTHFFDRCSFSIHSNDIIWIKLGYQRKNIPHCTIKQNCGFGHIYWRNPEWKTSFFVHCLMRGWDAQPPHHIHKIGNTQNTLELWRELNWIQKFDILKQKNEDITSWNWEIEQTQVRIRLLNWKFSYYLKCHMDNIIMKFLFVLIWAKLFGKKWAIAYDRLIMLFVLNSLV